jgi:hypothetical protein
MVSSLLKGTTQSASEGTLFWFVTHGDIVDGMPAWVEIAGEAAVASGEFYQIAGSGGEGAGGFREAVTAVSRMAQRPFLSGTGAKTKTADVSTTC